MSLSAAYKILIDAVDKAGEHRYLSKLSAESLTDRPRRKRVNPRGIKVRISKFKRKKKGDKGENNDYEKITGVLPHGDFSNETYDKAA